MRLPRVILDRQYSDPLTIDYFEYRAAGMQGIALILILGVSAQWIAWRLRVPSILLLLAFGFLAGPIAHRLDPDRMLGPSLQPLVAISVALILFEGGMSLKRSELRDVGGVVRNLATVGALVTGTITAVAVHYILHLPWELASLLGAILLVTGPTVIGPLLRHVRPMGQLGPILKWEGILIDPIGAMVAVLVFEAVQLSAIRHAAPVLVNEAFKTLGVGGGIGICVRRVDDFSFSASLGAGIIYTIRSR